MDFVHVIDVWSLFGGDWGLNVVGRMAWASLLLRLRTEMDARL